MLMKNPDISSISAVADIDSFDRILVAFSGGKDSLSCLLHLIETGVDTSKIELHRQRHWKPGYSGSGGKWRPSP